MKTKTKAIAIFNQCRIFLILSLTFLTIPGCSSGDSVKVSTTNNTPAVSEDGVGASVAIVVDSADDSIVVGSNASGGISVSRFLYDTQQAGDHIFCLENVKLIPAELTVADIVENKLSIVDSGCAAVNLSSGSYTLDISSPDYFPLEVSVQTTWPDFD